MLIGYYLPPKMLVGFGLRSSHSDIHKDAQAIINLLMVMGFLPVVGIPLPLFSYGGSSLMTTMIGLGILMNIRMRRAQSKTD